jgi:hypothetical protein
MSQPSPFARPQLQPPRHRWDCRVKVKVVFLTVIAVHVVFLLSVLMIQGCMHSERSPARAGMSPTNQAGLGPADVLPANLASAKRRLSVAIKTRRLNDFKGDRLAVGQELKLPTRAAGAARGAAATPSVSPSNATGSL